MSLQVGTRGRTDDGRVFTVTGAVERAGAVPYPRTYVLRAASRAQCAAWVRAINSASVAAASPSPAGSAKKKEGFHLHLEV